MRDGGSGEKRLALLIACTVVAACGATQAPVPVTIRFGPRRPFRSLALVLLTLSLLSACTTGAVPTSQSTPPTIAVPEATQPSGAAGQASQPAITITFACRGYEHSPYEELAQAFGQQNPAISVQVVSIDDLAGNSNILSADDAAKVASGADAFLGYARVMLEEAVPRGLVLDLSPLATLAGSSLDDFYPAPLALL